jgi:hypothetical protein
MGMETTATKLQGRARALAMVGAGLLLTLAAGFAYGHWTQRWGPPADLEAAAVQIKTLPSEIGPWRLSDESEVGKNVIEILQCSGYVNRSYVNQETGRAISLALIVGPPGPTSVHTPEICYSSRAYVPAEDREKVSLTQKGAPPNSFWGLTLEPRAAGAAPLRVYYAWSTGDAWTASSSPRFEFGGSRKLYKIQLAGLMDETSEEAADPCRDFLDSLVRCGWSLTQTQQSSP